MKATYLQRGEALDFVNKTESTIPAFTILVVGDMVGIAGTDIEPGATGVIYVCGVFEMPKSTDAAISMGTKVYFDGTGVTTDATTTQEVETTEEEPGSEEPGAEEESGAEEPETVTVNNTFLGYAAADAAATDSVVIVKLIG